MGRATVTFPVLSPGRFRSNRRTFPDPLGPEAPQTASCRHRSPGLSLGDAAGSAWIGSGRINWLKSSTIIKLWSSARVERSTVHRSFSASGHGFFPQNLLQLAFPQLFNRLFLALGLPPKLPVLLELSVHCFNILPGLSRHEIGQLRSTFPSAGVPFLSCRSCG